MNNRTKLPSSLVTTSTLLIVAVLSGCATGPHQDDSLRGTSAPQSLSKAPAVLACAPLPVTDRETCTVRPGTGKYLLIAGQVLTPDTVFQGGGVLVDPDGTILAVGCDARARDEAQDATQILCPTGVVSPGLINAHDHITYNWNPPSQWGSERYDRRNEWRKGSPAHKPITPTPQGTKDPELVAWSELRHVMGGTTSIAGSGGRAGLVRNLDKGDLLEGLKTDYVYYNTFPLGDSTVVTPHTIDCAYPKIDDPATVLSHQCYLPHVAEGIDFAANNEIHCMDSHGLITSNGAYIHSVAAYGKDGEMLQQRGASVVWSPRSNISLYGNTAQVTMYSNLGMKIALATDWTPSGSINLLRELQCADTYNTKNLGGFFSDYDLWMMVTANPADALHMDKQIGRLAPGLVADIAIFSAGTGMTPYRAIIDGNVNRVTLVLRGGVPLYGDTSIVSQVPSWNQGCEAFPGGVVGTNKTVCIQRELGESFATLRANNKVSYPLFFASVPPDEPTCVPSRPAIPGQESGYTGISTPDDLDGDGIPNALDNCPTIFNPIRPMDSGKQADCNGNGFGDACDPTPCR
ncbi:MAG: hypothetical protein EG825_04700 [Rhodocyclaceae bacterium]|nr:hypothetical protein [Rhodocyclaceae bacterium]